MDWTTIYALVGFLLAGYSVIANDSVQTLGTFIASNKQFKWYWLWLAASSVLVFTIAYGWYVNGGDISYGRLNKIPFQEVQWYHAAAPLVLVILTRFGIPVSTTFLVLSAFASTVVLEKVLVKSMIGYALAATVAYVVWFFIVKLIDEKRDVLSEKSKRNWRILQWLSTGFLWYSWLSHDMANIAVYLPRELELQTLIMVILFLVSGLAYIFWNSGGRIQKIVIEKTNTGYVRSATIIDFVYAILLLYFKGYNDIPMSTTWVFVGLLCGRELAYSRVSSNYTLKHIFPLVGKDFLKMLLGLMISIAIVLAIHNFLS